MPRMGPLKLTKLTPLLTEGVRMQWNSKIEGGLCRIHEWRGCAHVISSKDWRGGSWTLPKISSKIAYGFEPIDWLCLGTDRIEKPVATTCTFQFQFQISLTAFNVRHQGYVNSCCYFIIYFSLILSKFQNNRSYQILVA